MPKNEIIVGLDIGSSKTCCLIAEINNKKQIEIIGRGVSYSAGIRKGAIIDIEDTVKSIEHAVTEAERMAGFNISNVYVGITGEHISSLNSHGVVAVTSHNKEINEVDIRRVIEASKVVAITPERQIIHTLTQEYTVDGHAGVKNPIGMAGSRVEVDTHIISALSTLLSNVSKCIKLAGLEIEPNGIVFQPLASGLAVASDEEKEMGTIVIDIGAGTTDFVVFKNGSIYYSANIPIAGNHITTDVAYAFKIPFTEAEKIKINHSEENFPLAKSMNQSSTENPVQEESKLKDYDIDQIISARISEIFELTNAHVRKVMASGTYLTQAVITGGTSLVKGASKIAEEILDMPVRIGMPDKVKGMADTVKSPIYSTAVGLIIYGTKQQKRLNQKNKSTTLTSGFQKLVNWLQEIF